MWTVYKREIMQREKEQKDFLKKYYAHNKEQHEMQLQNGPMGKQGKGHVMPPRQESEDDWPVELDSDEEPMSFQAQKKHKEVRAKIFVITPYASAAFLLKNGLIRGAPTGE